MSDRPKIVITAAAQSKPLSEATLKHGRTLLEEEEAEEQTTKVT